tara:strand:- start:355 stop:1080 length:726 start_codon:yes stop_codon:yes gene_type:complete
MALQTFAGTGAGADAMNPQYDATKFIKMGVKDGVQQYAHKTAANDMELHRLASGPVNGTWSQADVDNSTASGGNPLGDGQVVGQAATGSWASRATSQNAFYDMTMAAQAEIAQGGGTNAVVNPGNQVGADPTGAGQGLVPGGQMGGATPTGGDYLTPPTTNANVNQPLTNISQVMSNNSRVPTSAGASTLGGRTPTEGGGLGRPTSSGGSGVSRTPQSKNLALGANANSKLDSIKKVGIRF